MHGTHRGSAALGVAEGQGLRCCNAMVVLWLALLFAVTDNDSYAISDALVRDRCYSGRNLRSPQDRAMEVLMRPNPS